MHRPDRSPSQRFRFEQYLDYFNNNNFEYEFSYLLDKEDDINFYHKKKYFQKAKILINSIKKRFKDIKRIKNKEFDIVFIQREALMIGGAFFEKKISLISDVKMIFDFDDSIWLPNSSKANKKFMWLKSFNKVSKIIELSDHVIAGNEYLYNYAKNYNQKTSIIPTTVDTDKFKPTTKRNQKKVTIGWSGSSTTIEHFKLAIPILEEIKKKYKNKIDFKIIGDKNFYNPSLNVYGVDWCSETEVLDLNEIDIGIMPLPDDEWSKGKCGLKGLTYMSLEIPTIMSPVGVNCDIIEHGVNGFLAKTDSEWHSALSMLIESEELRKEIGKKGRQTVVQKYSVLSQRDNYLKILTSTSSKPSPSPTHQSSSS